MAGLEQAECGSGREPTAHGQRVLMSGIVATALRIPSLRAGAYPSLGGSAHGRWSSSLTGQVASAPARGPAVPSLSPRRTSPGKRLVVRVSESDLVPSEIAIPLSVDHGLSRSHLPSHRPVFPSLFIASFTFYQMVDIPENERIPFLPWVEW